MVNKLIRARSSFASLLTGPWNMKLFYLGYFSTMGVYLPYLGLYLGASDLSGTQIGLIASMSPLASVLMPPIWGWLSDHHGWRKQVLIVALMSALLTSLLLWWIAHSFVLLLLLISCLALVLSSVSPLADAITLQWIEQQGGSYGSIRVYGSLGFLIASIVAGNILNIIGISWLFLLLAIVFCGPVLASLFVPAQSKTGMTPFRGLDLLLLLRDRTLLLFTFLCMVGFGTFAAYGTFFSLYMRSLGVSTAAIGLATGLGSLSELPLMMLSGLLMKRLSVKWLLIIGLSVAAVRWLAYATFTSYALLFAFTLLHGISFACFYTASVTFIDRRVPIHLRTTGQTLFYGATFGLGTWLSTNLFGVLYDRFYGNGMFLCAAIICTAAILGLLFSVPHNPVRMESSES